MSRHGLIVFCVVSIGVSVFDVTVGGFSVRSVVAFRLVDVGLVEKVKEQHEVGEIHDKRPFDVLVADLARQAGFLARIGYTVDVDAEYHLKYLSARDGDVDPFGYVKT